VRLEHDCEPRVHSAVWYGYPHLILPQMERVVLAAVLSQSIADADTMLDVLQRHHNRRVRKAPGSGAVAADRRCTETGDTSVLWHQYKSIPFREQQIFPSHYDGD
jgi:hypothetical protein